MNAPILGSRIRAKIKLSEKLYEAFKAGYLKSMQNHTKTSEDGEKPAGNTLKMGLEREKIGKVEIGPEGVIRALRSRCAWSRGLNRQSIGAGRLPASSFFLPLRGARSAPRCAVRGAVRGAVRSAVR